MALSGATNALGSVTAKVNSQVYWDKTSGNFFSSGVHLGLTLLPAATTPTVTASPYTYTNTFTGTGLTSAVTSGAFGIQQVFINGGTMTAITLNRSGTSTTVPITVPMVLLGVNDSITLTYSAAPTVAVLQMI